MANYHTVEILNTYKNPILNHFGKNLFLCFMTNKPFTANKKVDLTRKNHGHAHLRYQTWEESNGFRQYNDYKYVYVTSSLFEEEHELCLTLREDLILSWAQSAAYKETNVLVLDYIHEKIAEVPCEYILDLYNHEKCSIKLNKEFKTLYAAFSLDHFASYFEDMDRTAYNGTAFNANCWNPQYIGNTTYSIHRADTACKIRIFDKNGNRCLFREEFKSLKEAFDTIKRASSNIDITYKTFQRRSKTHKPIVTEKGSIILVARESDNFQFPDVFDVSQIEKTDPVLGTINKDHNDITENEKEDLQKSETPVKDYVEIYNVQDIENKETEDFEENIESNHEFIDVNSADTHCSDFVIPDDIWAELVKEDEKISIEDDNDELFQKIAEALRAAAK